MVYSVSLSRVRAQKACVWHLWGKSDSGDVKSIATGFAPDYDECKSRALRSYIYNVDHSGTMKDLVFIDDGDRDVLFPQDIVQRYAELRYELKKLHGRLLKPFGESEDVDAVFAAVDAADQAIHDFELTFPLLLADISPYNRAFDKDESM